MNIKYEFIRKEQGYNYLGKHVASTTPNDTIKEMVLKMYSLDELNCPVLTDLKNLFRDFDAEEGLYKFHLHYNKVLEFEYRKF